MLFQMIPSHGEMVFHRPRGNLQDSGDFLDAFVLEIEQDDDGLLLFRNKVQGPVKLLVTEAGIRSIFEEEILSNVKKGWEAVA